MDFLPKYCRVCKNGKYKIEEFNYDRAKEYLESINIEREPRQTEHAYCLMAIYHAMKNKQDPKQFYDINEYTCAYKDECKFAKI